MNSLKVTMELKSDEGFKGMPYQDKYGYWTIGYGTKLPLSEEEAEMILQHRLTTHYNELLLEKPIVAQLPEVAQNVLANMAYQLGVPKLMRFKRMWEAIEERDWCGMVREMLDSKWAKIDSPDRAKRLASKIRETLCNQNQ
jgi:lysozyme